MAQLGRQVFEEQRYELKHKVASITGSGLMSESFRTRLLRWGFNLFPAFRRTGGRITYISSDLKRVRVQVPLNWKTRNYVGTLFGGSMYGAVDPIYMVMFIKLLGPEYIVWDKAAHIQFKKPGRSALTAEFTIDDEELKSIRNDLEKVEKVDRTYQINLLDDTHVTCASIEKTLQFRKRRRDV